MTRKEVVKDFFKITVFPVILVFILYSIFNSMLSTMGDSYATTGMVFFCCGIPFGIRRMSLWIFPHGFDIGGSMGVLFLNIVLGAIIGFPVLVWKMLKAAWYIPLSIYRFITAI